MHADSLTTSLELTGKVIVELFAGISPDEARRRPAPGKWSQLEVLCHLLDEERDDFRHRIALTLENPEQDWPGIDPEGWARDRKYNERDPARMREEFRDERERSIAWLRGLGSPDWNRAKAHPSAGNLTAGDLFAAWVAHDHLHLRQIVNVRIALLEADVQPYSTRYAMP